MGPEATQRFINPEEVIKRLAAAQGIDILNLVRSMQELQQEQQALQQQEMVMRDQEVNAKLASAPMMDPSKNPQLQEELSGREAQ